MPAAFFRVGTWLMATGRDMSIKEPTTLRRLCAPSALKCLCLAPLSLNRARRSGARLCASSALNFSCLVPLSLSIAHAAAALATILRARRAARRDICHATTARESFTSDQQPAKTNSPKHPSYY